MSTENSVSTLPATAALPAVAIDPATAALPAVAIDPATAALPAVAIDPATAALPAVAIDLATAAESFLPMWPSQQAGAPVGAALLGRLWWGNASALLRGHNGGSGTGWPNPYARMTMWAATGGVARVRLE